MVEKEFREIDLFNFTSFFGLDFFKFFGSLCLEKDQDRPLVNNLLCLAKLNSHQDTMDDHKNEFQQETLKDNLLSENQP